MFGAGDLESPSPYGLTPAEKVIVKNKETISKTNQNVKKVDTLIKELSQRLDGLESIFEGDGQKLNSVYIDLNKHLKEFESFKLEQERLKDEIKEGDLKLDEKIAKNEHSLSTNEQNIKSLKKSFDKIVKLVNEINSSYVTKKEFNKLIGLLDKKEQVKTKKKTVENKSEVPNKSNKELMEDARALFKKDYFTRAIPILDHLMKSNYRPAECNFLMGEIKYYRKKYKEALHYFKTSMMLYDKASYLPKLLLHSAISFEKTGDKDNASNFYSTLIDIYPDSIEAKEASKKIK
jgi:TolA-binding protein